MDLTEEEMKPEPSLLSVIVPAFNEEESIRRCVEELATAMQKAGCSAEIIVVNDGSTDGTLSAVRSMQTNFASLRVVNFKRNYGKATALREGLRAAKGTTIAFFDADLQYDPADLVKLVSKLDYGADVVTGLRDYRHYHPTRTVLSKIYNRLLRLVFRLDVSDSNCGIKVLKRNVVDPNFLFRYGLPLVVPLLKIKGVISTEMPVSLHDRRAGKSKYFEEGHFLGGIRNMREIVFHSIMLLALLARAPSELGSRDRRSNTRHS